MLSQENSPNMPAPPLSPPPSSLSAEINAATRQPHTTLNRFLTSRLPLALPPISSSPRLYTHGLTHFAHIYLTIESLLSDLSDLSTPRNPSLSLLLSSPDTTPPRPALLSLLSTLLPPGLPRSTRLKQDLAQLYGLSDVDLAAHLSHFPGEVVQDFAAHLTATAQARPHVLLAYAWVLYMALFSGGRWIRAQLASAPREFWLSAPPASSSRDRRRRADASQQDSINNLDATPEVPLRFFNFEGEADGEDVKAEFKAGFAAADMVLTQAERRDVIGEALSIFAFSIRVVEELDCLLATPKHIVVPMKGGVDLTIVFHER
ncbi:heme oxygenase-like protein [Patellaria atrata CBS 101060]|uniref:Heme oxygenase-like protein n=1 Tax=Patellaria atrata CBS 101060 TaxID=1346257 RepID=A0A9P4SAT2_9PEZI|nr:heme oxygenase-like protein [Patellaria atrata CBS 101060]